MSPRGAAATDNAAYTEALAQLSAAGVDSVSTAITDNKGMNLAIDLGLLDGEESMDLARLSAQAHVVQTQQLREAEEAAAAAEAAEAARANVLASYDGVMICCSDTLNVRAEASTGSAIVRTSAPARSRTCSTRRITAGIRSPSAAPRAMSAPTTASRCTTPTMRGRPRQAPSARSSLSSPRPISARPMSTAARAIPASTAPALRCGCSPLRLLPVPCGLHAVPRERAHLGF